MGTASFDEETVKKVIRQVHGRCVFCFFDDVVSNRVKNLCFAFFFLVVNFNFNFL